MKTISQLITSTTADFDTMDLQRFMLALQKCQRDYVKQDDRGILYTDHFDLKTCTFILPQLDCSTPSFTDEDLEAFKVLKHVYGDFILTSPKIRQLDGLRNLESIKGNLILDNSGVEKICGLNKLKTTKSIELSGMEMLTDICGFNNLTMTTDRINIVNNPNLTHINGFNSLCSVKSSILIGSNKSLLSINGFNSLEEIDIGSLKILANGSLESIHGFNRLRNIKDTLAISECKKLATLLGLSNLYTVENIFINETILTDLSCLENLFRRQKNFRGSIKITSNRLAKLTFMKELISVGSSFYLHQNRLANLAGLESLETIGASFSLGSNKLNDISQLANLKKINGILGLSNNQLTTLHGLENLRSVKTTTWNGTPLTIKLNDNKYPDGRVCLTDISALANTQEIGRNIILYVNIFSAYNKIPAQNSNYHTNVINIIEKDLHTNHTLVPSEFIQSLSIYKEQRKVPVLFSNRWQTSLKKCTWLSPFCNDLRDPDEIIKFCRRNNIQLLFANTIWLQYILLNNRDTFLKSGLLFLNNNQFSLDCFKDKGLFYEFMKHNNLLEFMPKHYSDIDSEELLNKPYILKDKISSNSAGVRIVLSGEQVHDINENTLITEYIAGGEEYASNILFKDGEIVKHISYKKIHGDPIYILSPETRGNMIDERCEPACMDIFKNILSLANPIGGYCLCCIDYKMVGPTPKIFEINARMGYTLARHPIDFTEMMNVYIEHAYALGASN